MTENGCEVGMKVRVREGVTVRVSVRMRAVRVKRRARINMKLSR